VICSKARFYSHSDPEANTIEREELPMTKFWTILVLLSFPLMSAPARMTVKAVNRLQLERSQTIELSFKDLMPLGEKDPARIHVQNAAGNEMLCQAVDTDGDYDADRIIFQADFAPGETRSFTVTSGAKWTYTSDQFKAYGRFVRERFDDFAWENDRIAHRMYGKALQTWVREPLASSTVDIWSKRVPRMVINDWYMADNYHVDSGEGADFYSANISRGCGGNGLWAADKLWVSSNFVNSRVLANGPIRVMFELTYEPFDVNGSKVAEVKRITLDAGRNLDYFQSFYKSQNGNKELISAIGLKKTAGDQKEFNARHGWLAQWEKMEKNAGNQGLAVIVDPKSFVREAEDRLNRLVLSKVDADGMVSYWAGFIWDKNGADYIAWRTYVDNFAQGLLSPIEVTVSSNP
jgi:hypothetical protein